MLSGCLGAQASGRGAAAAGHINCAPWPQTWRCMQPLKRHRGQLQVCEAHPRRVAKVASQIQREISEMFVYDKVLQEAICPERRQGLDGALSAIASVSYVYVSNDLQVVKAYVSVYSDERGKKQAMGNLKRLEGYVRRQIGQKVPLRLTPEIRFEYDDSMEEAEMVQKVIGDEDFARYQREAAEEAGAAGPASSSTLVTTAAAAAGADDDDSGFFELDDADEDEEEEEAEGEWVEEPYGAFFSQPGPFDDMFQGSGDALVSLKPNKPRLPQQKPKPKAKQQGGKQQQKPKQQSGKPQQTQPKQQKQTQQQQK